MYVARSGLAFGVLALAALPASAALALLPASARVESGPVGLQDPPAERELEREPVPAPAARSAPRERIEALIAMPQVRASKNRARQQAAVQRLLDAGRGPASDPPAERYAFLELALELAEEIGDATRAREVIAALSARFEVERGELLFASALEIAALERSDAKEAPALVALFVEAGNLLLSKDLEAAARALAAARVQLVRFPEADVPSARRSIDDLAARLATLFAMLDRLPTGALLRSSPPPETESSRQATREAIRQDIAARAGTERSEQLALLERWRREGFATRRNPAGARFEYLRAALDVAARLGDLRSLEELLAELDAQFETDLFAVESEVLQRAANQGSMDAATATRAFLMLARRAAPTRTDVARDALAASLAAFSRLKQERGRDEELHAELSRVHVELSWLAEEAELRQALLRDPRDAASAERLGWLLCLRFQRWSEGLSLLATHATSTLEDGSATRDIARLDGAEAPSAADLRRIATAWRAHAKRAGLVDEERSSLLRRALERYELVPRPTTLDRWELQSLRKEIVELGATLADTQSPFESADQGRAIYVDRFDRPPLRLERGGTGTEKAVESGLRWLKYHQDEDGKWNSDAFHAHCEAAPCEGMGSASHDVGLTGLALLAFLGDGHHPSRKTPYQRVVRSGVHWLVENMSAGEDDGLIGGRSNHAFMYDHAIAALALCEAYLVSQQEHLRGPAQRAVNFALRARNPYKAWRYEAPPNGENDSSVTGWMVMLLKTAEDAGLDIDKAAFEGALSLFDELTDSSTGRCGYINRGEPPARPTGKSEQWPSANSEALTAVALLSRFFLGQSPERNPLLTAQADLMLSKLPAWPQDDTSTVDFYYWFYGSFAMFQMGGKYWEKWNDAMKPALVKAQRQDGHLRGSWDPVDPWGDDGGRIYATAMSVLCLEVYYRYLRIEELDPAMSGGSPSGGRSGSTPRQR
jgi:hypothetical protein